jgi:hypothetical protein
VAELGELPSSCEIFFIELSTALDDGGATFSGRARLRVPSSTIAGRLKFDASIVSNNVSLPSNVSTLRWYDATETLVASATGSLTIDNPSASEYIIECAILAPSTGTGGLVSGGASPTCRLSLDSCLSAQVRGSRYTQFTGIYPS